jgi:hypothetical protein
VLIDIQSDTTKRYIMFFVVFVFFLLGFLGAPKFTAIFLGLSFSGVVWIGIYFLYFLISFLMLLIVFIRTSVPSYIRDIIPRSAIAWELPVMLVYTVGAYKLSQLPAWSSLYFLVLSALVGWAVYFIPSFALILLMDWIAKLQKTKARGKYPNSIIVDEMLLILCRVDNKYAQWDEPWFKKEIVARLERLATYIEEYFPLQMKCKDPFTDFWLKTQTHQMAAFFRALKTWILVPKSDTRLQFKAQIQHSLVCALNGEWDGLQRIEPEKISPFKAWKAKLNIIFRALIAGVIPPLVLLVIQRTPLAVKGMLADYLAFGVIIWMVLTLISVLDPSYSEKVSTLKNIASVLSGAGRSGNP